MPFDTDAQVSDDALMVLFANGDGQAAEVLAWRHTPRVLALARRMLSDMAEAEDVAQEALMRLWKIAPDWRAGEAKVSTWLYRVTANLCTDRLRRRRTTDLDAVPEQMDDAPSAEVRLMTADRAAALQGALARLPERQRLAVSLRFLSDLPNPEVADIMGVSVDAVESLLARGKRALATALAGRRDELGL
ncbi:MAG: RNA polymerase sigma factor [Pseudomonadota bacterium]